MSHNVSASEVVDVPEPEFVKKSFIQFVLAVEWRVAEMITHAVATENAETVARMCSVIYRRNRMVLS